MDTARPESESIERQARDADVSASRSTAPSGSGRRRLAVLVLCAAITASAAVARASAGEASEPAPVEVPAPLGAGAAELGERFGASLRAVAIAQAGSVFQQIAPGAAPEPATQVVPPATPAPAQTRLARPARGDIERVEYDLSEGRVYRVRWQLAERFEHPILNELVPRLSERLGRPDYDQTLHAELGSERADLRRTGWTLGRRVLEVRQLHPFTGGPIFLSLADVDAMQAIVDAQGTPLPQPDTTGAWWRRPQRPPELPTAEQRRELIGAIDALVGKLSEAPPSPAAPSNGVR